MMKVWKLVGIQIVQIPIVILVFKSIPDVKVAGVIAGLIFLSVALYLANEFYKLLGRTSWAFYFFMVQVFLISFPMLSKRVLNWQLDFNDIEIWGMSGDQFHQVSTYFFYIVFVVSILDLWRIKKRQNN